ncbi:MAG: DUF4255 domain-containing protein [Bacteroidales bacterium]|nr:DUF4255 domain-containing protein [Bacteroidales bacterium]
MIDLALSFLRDELAAYVLARTNSTSVDVKLTSLVNEAGKYAFGDETIALSVINLEEDRTFRAQVPEYNYVNGQHVKLNPELKFNIHLMAAANFTIYSQSWKAISLVLSFFQSHSSFSSTENPALDPSIERLSVELETLSFEQLNQVWAYVGGKYLPSAVYKIRIVVIQDEEIAGVQSPITSIKTQFSSK